MAARRVVLLAVVILMAACTSPVPMPTPEISAEPSPLSGELSHFGNGFGLQFDYPAEWPVIADSEFVGADEAVAVLGTGAWNTGCVHTPNSVTCTGQQFIADPGEFVASIVTRMSGPANLAYEVPPIDGVDLIPSGLAVQRIDGLSRAIEAAIYVPGHRQFQASFRFGSEPTDAARAAVTALLQSLVYTGDARSTSITTWDSSAAQRDCIEETLAGQLSRGDMSGVNLAGPEWTVLSWPQGWRTQAGDLGRVEIIDEDGAVVGREWDQVSLGGRGDPNEFRICPGAVDVVHAFPSD